MQQLAVAASIAYCLHETLFKLYISVSVLTNQRKNSNNQKIKKRITLHASR